jgi:hypothetical protein
MCTHRQASRAIGILIVSVPLLTFVPPLSQGAPHSRFGFGTQAEESEIQLIDIAVGADGEGLPEGRGSVSDGEKVYLAKCQGCHGPNGGGGPYDQLVGGQKPVKTVGSFWPYATTVFDYTRRAMPFNKPGTLSNDEVYAVTAWILWKNGIIPQDAIMDKSTLTNVRMPNRNGFVPDPRPDVAKPITKSTKK